VKLHALMTRFSTALGDVRQSVLTRRHVQELARNELSQRLLTVFDIVNTSIDHVPPAMYEYEV
jgi:hypothetical protein